MPDPIRKTCVRHDIPGDAHALTFCCFRRQRFLTSDRARQWLIEAIDQARHEHNVDIWAYVIMPEHVHLVIFPRKDDYSVSDILTSIKRPVARKVLRYVEQHAPSFLPRMREERPGGKVSHSFWLPGGGYDRNLVDPRIIRKTIDYIHANPVRRGLVNEPCGWYWSSAGYYLDGRSVPLIPDRDSIPAVDHLPE